MVYRPEYEQSQESPDPQRTPAKKEKESDLDADDGCLCKRWCSPKREDLLTMKKLKELVRNHFNPNSKRKLGAQENAFHIIKLIKSLKENVGRKWEEHKRIQNGSQPGKNREGWLKSILDETEETLNQENQLDRFILGAANKQTISPPISLLEERSDLAECEKEQIHIIAAQIKMQRGEIRHFECLLKEGIRRIEGNI